MCCRLAMAEHTDVSLPRRTCAQPYRNLALPLPLGRSALMIVAVANLKGGVGKSLVALHLAGEAMARGLRTLVVDADVQRSALTWNDVAVEAGQSAPTVVGASQAMAKQLPGLAAGYDLTIIDTPPRGDVMTRAAFFVADAVVIPTGPAPTDFWALASTLELVQQAQALRPDLRAALLLNRLQTRQGLSMHAREALGHTGIPVLAATLGNRTAFAESLARGGTVASHDPTSVAADEVRALFNEVMA